MIKHMSNNDNKYYTINTLQNNKLLQFKISIFCFNIF